jgi:molybdate transport system ATP-binding protein
MTTTRTLSVSLALSRRGHDHSFELSVELVAPPGITILFGPSGSGKSTILQCIAGLLSADSGRIALGDQVWFDRAGGVSVPTEQRHVAYVFQSLALFPHLTAVGNVAYGIDRTRPRAERRDRARALLDRLGVGHLANRRPRGFSGGEAQRVALARAMAMQPRVLLLDEPFSALDRDLRIQLAREVRGLVDELGLPAVQVTHNHAEARAMGDRVIRMAHGRIVAAGSIDEILGPRSRQSEASDSPDADDFAEDTPLPDLQG